MSNRVHATSTTVLARADEHAAFDLLSHAAKQTCDKLRDTVSDLESGSLDGTYHVNVQWSPGEHDADAIGDLLREAADPPPLVLKGGDTTSELLKNLPKKLGAILPYDDKKKLRCIIEEMKKEVSQEIRDWATDLEEALS